jgi:hypothetical protein
MGKAFVINFVDSHSPVSPNPVVALDKADTNIKKFVVTSNPG